MQSALAESFCHRFRHIGFGQYQSSSVFSDAGFHLLFVGNRFRASLFCLGTRHSRICFGLIGLESSADVFADVDVGDVDGNDFECGVSIQAATEYGA